RFNELEQVVRHNLLEALKHFVEVGKALKEIRDDKLYKDFSYASVDAYLDERWDLKKFAPSDDRIGALLAAWRDETNRLPPQRPRPARPPSLRRRPPANRPAVR